METLSTTAGSIGIRPNGTDLSDFRSFRGSGNLPRSVVAVRHSSRLEGAPKEI